MSDNFEARIETLKQMGKRLLRRLFGSGGIDPFAAVRVPKSGKPRGRAGAIAVEEPQAEVTVDLVGRRPS